MSVVLQLLGIMGLTLYLLFTFLIPPPPSPGWGLTRVIISWLVVIVILAVWYFTR